MALKLVTLFSCLLSFFTIIILPVVRTLVSYEGKAVSFHCLFTQSVQNVIWRYYVDERDIIAEIVSVDKNIVSSFKRGDRFQVYIGNGLSRLSIRNAQSVDTGVYKCSSETHALSTYPLYVVQTDFPLCQVIDPTGQPGNVKVNDNVFLSCSSGFNSNYPKIRWLRGSNYTTLEEVVQSNILYLPIKLGQQDEDVTFTCVLGEGDPRSAPSCSVTPLRSQPVVSIVPMVANVTEGEDFVFECSGRVNSGNITYDWDETTLLQFAGRYELNARKTKLQISDLKVTDDAKNVTCLVTVDTGTKGSSVATLRVIEQNKSTSNGNLNGGDEESGDGRTETGGVKGGSTGLIIGVISVCAIAILTIIAVILISKKKKSKNHPAPLSPRIKSANFSEGVVRSTSQYYDDTEQYAVTGPTMTNDNIKNEQIAFFSEGQKSSGFQVTYAVAGQHEDKKEGSMTAYDEVDSSKPLQHLRESSCIPEYFVIENPNDSVLPVYAEVNRGATEQLPSEKSRNGDGTYEMYADVNTQDDKLAIHRDQTALGADLIQKPNYAKVNKKGKEDKEEPGDGYAKPDFTVSEEVTYDEDENQLPLASSPLYAEVQKSDMTESETTKDEGKTKEKPKYAKVNKKTKIVASE